MNNSLRIAKILSIFVDMTGLCRLKNETISFKQQLHNEVIQKRVTANEERIVLQLMGIEKANTINREDDPRLINILNIVELCTSVNMDKADIYNYINGEFKTGRINQSNRDLLMEAFNVTYQDAKKTIEPERKPEIKYYTLEEIKAKGWTVTVYKDKNRNIETAKQFWSHDASFTFMMQDKEILDRIKVGYYDIDGDGEKIRVRQYIDRDHTPMTTVVMTKKIDARIDPQEIMQAERVLKYVNKYDSNLWMPQQIRNDSTVKIGIDKNKITEANRTGNIFKLFKR